MTKQTINVGTSANDRKGDSLRAAFQKVNANFTELYSSSGFTGTTDRLVNGSYEVVLSSAGILTMPDGLTINNSVVGYSDSTTISEETPGGTISSTTTLENQIAIDSTNSITISKVTTQINDDGVVTSTDSTGTILEITGISGSLKRYVEPDGPNNSAYLQVRTDNDGAILEGVEENVGSTTYGRVAATQGVIAISAGAGGIDQDWSFDFDGNFTLPSAGLIRQNHSFTRTTLETALAATSTVVWSANADWMSSIKLTIQVEGHVTGDDTGWHVQTCEATIASRGYANGVNGYGDPEMSVYGIIYTSLSPLATFEVQRNVNTRLVEVVATGTDLNNNIIVSIHSVEIGTTD